MITAVRPVSNPDELALWGDPWTPTGKPLADAFRTACYAEAQAHGGRVDPSNVRLRLLDDPAYEARRFSALWGWACGRDGFLDKTGERVEIHGAGSRGNANKSTFYRRWRGWGM